jgi:hypothetical protein
MTLQQEVVMTRLFRAAALIAALMLLSVSTALATHGQPQQEVPIGGVLSGADSYGDPSTCPAGAVWRYFQSGTGEFSHLGAVTVETTHCTWLDSATTGHAGPGTITLTAANGDTLVLAHQVTFEFGMPTPGRIRNLIDLEWEVVAGTGRFEGATGTGGGSGISDIDLATGASATTVTLWGTFAHDASNRASD